MTSFRDSPKKRFCAFARFSVPGVVSALALAFFGCSDTRVDTGSGWVLLQSDQFAYSRAAGLSQNWIGYSSPDWSIVSVEPFIDSGGWRIEDSSLVGYSHGGFYNITWKAPIDGDIRVEWEVTPLRRNLNLNCYIGGQTRRDGYTFHIAGYDNPRICVLTKGQTIQRLDQTYLPEGIELKRTYRLRMEKDGQYIRLFINERQVFNYRDYDVLSGPNRRTFGFENNNGNSLRIDNVHVYHRPGGTDTSALAVATGEFEQGRMREALALYQNVLSHDASDDITAAALYKAGRCFEALERMDSAISSYAELERRFPRHELSALAGAQRAMYAERRGDSARAGQIYRDLGKRFPGHAVLRSVFFDMVNAREDERTARTARWIRDSSDDGSTAQWLVSEGRRVRELGRSLGVDLKNNTFLELVATTLSGAEIYSVDQLIAEFPEQRAVIAEALNSAGRYEDVIRDYRDIPGDYAIALLSLGRYRKAATLRSSARVQACTALVILGQYERALSLYPDQRPCRAAATRMLGRFDELFSDYADITSECIPAARDLGRTAEYFSRISPDNYSIANALHQMVNKSSIALLVLESYPESFTFRDNLLTIEAMRSVGRFREGLERFKTVPQMETPCNHNLLSMGLSEEALARYPKPTDRIRALGERGEFQAIIDTYPRRLNATVEALIRMGRFDEARGVQKRSLPLRALTLMLERRYREVVKTCRDERVYAGEALLALGDYTRIARDFSDQRMICARALIAQDSIDEALERYPESRALCAAALLESGKYELVAKQYADQPAQYAEALIELGRYNEVPFAGGKVWLTPRDAFDAHCLGALHEWRTGNTSAAESLLAVAPPTFDHLWPEHRFSRYLLSPVLMALAGNRSSLDSAADALGKSARFVYGRRLWYEAAFLGGQIDESAFVSQPFACGARERLVLLKAIADDIAGRRGDAASGYREWLSLPLAALPEYLTDLDRSRAVRRFVRWRIGYNTRS